MNVRSLMVVVGLGFASVGAVACGGGHPAASPAQGEEGIEVWSDHHKEASEELANWVKGHKEAARLFFEWDGHHPARSREFVTWAIEHPGENIDAFVATHRGWEYFDEIAEKHRPAADAFLAWCRHHPRAAEALMHHEHGLEWAGHHLYSAYWDMK